MFPSIEIVNTTQQTLEFQKGGRLIRLTPGRNTLGTHEWPFAQRAFGDRVRLAKDIPEKTYIDGPNAPVREPEPEPVNLDEAERLEHEEHLADQATDGGPNPDYVPEPEPEPQPEPGHEKSKTEKEKKSKKDKDKGK